MEQNLNNIFWQKFKYVKNDSIRNYQFLFLLNIYPQTMANMDINFLAENLLNENIFDMEFLKTNLFHIGGEGRIKSLCEYIETNELAPQKKKNKFRLLLNSSIFAECLVYISYDDFVSIAINRIESNVINQWLRSCSKQKANSIYGSIAKSDFNQDKKIKTLKLILCQISDEALNYFIEQNIIDQNIVTVFYGQPGNYMLSEGRRCIKEDKNMTKYIKTSLKKFKVQKKKPSKKQKRQDKINNNPNPQISYNENNGNSNIIEDDLKIDQRQTEINTKINQGQNDPNKDKRNDLTNNKILTTDDKSNNSNNNIKINQNQNGNNGNIVTQIFTEAQQVPTTDNNANNRPNVPPNNRINLNENQNPAANNFNSDDTEINIEINQNQNENNGNIITQISTEAQRIQQIPTTDNDPNNKSNMPPNNKKTRIGLGVVGLIFIIAVFVCCLQLQK